MVDISTWPHPYCAYKCPRNSSHVTKWSRFFENCVATLSVKDIITYRFFYDGRLKCTPSSRRRPKRLLLTCIRHCLADIVVKIRKDIRLRSPKTRLRPLLSRSTDAFSCFWGMFKTDFATTKIAPRHNGRHFYVAISVICLKVPEEFVARHKVV